MDVFFIDIKGNQVGLNTGYAYLAGILKKNGHTVRVIDLNHFHHKEDERLHEVKKADIIGISLKSFTIDEGNRIAKKVKRINPNVPIICGGAHLTIDGYKFMKEFPVYDIAAIGDGEYTMLEIADGKPLESVKGIIFRKDGKVKVNMPREMIQDLDDLPFPDYTCFDSIVEYGVYFPYNYYPLVTSRGCPCSCTYCSVPLVSGKKWRARSAENIVLELKQMKKQWGLKEFAVFDDNLTVNINRAKDFCKMLIDEKIGLKWQCPNGIKATNTDIELAGLMKKSGCYYINLGVESGDPGLFETIKKGGTLEHIRKAIQNFKSVGIRVGGFFMIGLPESTKAMDEASIKLSTTFGLDAIMWSSMVPYPGTPAYDQIYKAEKGRFKIVNDWKDGLSCGKDISAIFETKDYSAEDRKHMFYKANIRTRHYGNVLNMNFTNTQKAMTLLSMVIRYDPARFFHHMYWIGKGLGVGIKNRTVRISF